MNTYAATINATEYPPHLKHKIIFETFDALQSEESMLLVNDHDPKPLRFQFQSTHADGFEWEYIEQGPITFQVKITKR
ncbi:hypothetical protein PAECIP112173_01642 [Paenibacillus sp. JJ-100]|uniref:DUF2249 domain-containing protein n=1 Tax=Paenibacillus sp. JJ-100 TaxID=2974896 RepID=UPI0022FFA2A8|nr:DUF2249 domain-containing protein [Paenibacillus sp. JJ-100]CAI6057305.1 hypothetical protein PAECIP112173_01642 [Paenibacillus sp. JJ-100]